MHLERFEVKNFSWEIYEFPVVWNAEYVYCDNTVGFSQKCNHKGSNTQMIQVFTFEYK